MASNFMADLSGLSGIESIIPKTSTSRQGNTELKMEDFLNLMIVQLQNQSIDDTADTGEMLNQMVQMQMITALTNMTDASVMGYASSLVGKEVTIGVSNGKTIEERVLTVTGTGQSNGQQVIFCDDGNTYQLSQVMAVGRLPEREDAEKPDTAKGHNNEWYIPPATEYVPLDGNGTGTANNGADAVGGVNPGADAGQSDNDGGKNSTLEDGLLDGLLRDPNEGKTGEVYTGEQGVPEDGAE